MGLCCVKNVIIKFMGENMKIETETYNKMPKELQDLLVVKHESHCPCKMLDEQSGVSKDGVAVRRHGNNAKGLFPVKIKDGSKDVGFGGQGGASRFFYCAKSSKKERNMGCEELFMLKEKVSEEDIKEIKHLLSI